MPKEIVRGERPFDGRWQKPGEDEWVDVTVPVESVVEVRWDRETGYFQMATRWIDASTGADVSAYPDEMKYIYGEPTAEEEAAFLARSEGIYISLDRRGINNLIRNLRRARDQAFGKDE